ncbi:MAG: DUF3397 family protein [Leuconostoc fallax]
MTNWWWWPIGVLLFDVGCFIINKFLNKNRLNILDIIVIPNWIGLHYTMGYAFGLSYIWWLLLAWLIVGLLLAGWLMSNTKRWCWQKFWHNYWRLSGLVAVLLFIFLIIIKLIMG